MLCDRCIAVFENPRLSSQQVDDEDLQVLHPNFSSLETALKEECGFCHWLVHALISRGDSRILSDLELCPDIDPESFSLRCRFAYESEDRKVISCLAVWLVQRSGGRLRESCIEHLFFSPGN